MIKNEQGQIAMAYYQPIPQAVKVGDVTYYFVTQRAVSLAWINEEHVADILRITKRCCGGNVHIAYHYATQGEVNVWSNTGR